MNEVLFDALLVLSSLHSSTTGLSRATLKVNVTMALTGIALGSQHSSRTCLVRDLTMRYTLSLYRVGADRYILNPTRVELTSKLWKGVQENVEINYDILETLLDSAYDILECLEKY